MKTTISHFRFWVKCWFRYQRHFLLAHIFFNECRNLRQKPAKWIMQAYILLYSYQVNGKRLPLLNASHTKQYTTSIIIIILFVLSYTKKKPKKKCIEVCERDIFFHLPLSSIEDATAYKAVRQMFSFVYGTKRKTQVFHHIIIVAVRKEQRKQMKRKIVCTTYGANTLHVPKEKYEEKDAIPD